MSDKFSSGLVIQYFCYFIGDSLADKNSHKCDEFPLPVMPFPSTKRVLKWFIFDLLLFWGFISKARKKEKNQNGS